MGPGDISIKLLPVSPGDADELATLRVLAMQESLERIGRFDESRARARFLSSFSVESTRHIEMDGERIGFIVLTAQPDHLSLDHFYIHPDRQGVGAGSSVLKRLFSEADEIGKSLRVGALKESDSNRFYTRHGFKFVESSEFDHYYVRRARSDR